MDSRHRYFGIGVSVCLVILAGAAAASVSALFAGCGPAGTPGLPAGRLKVVMGRTPSPTEPLKAASITIMRVEVLRQQTARGLWKNAGVLDSLQTTDPVDHSWIVVQEGEQIVNLMEICAGRANLLINADLPEGRYSRLRLTCGEGRVTLHQPSHETPDRTFVLDPNREKAGEVTLECEFLVAPSRETALLLSVDVNRAFPPIRGTSTQRDTPQGFRFSPRTAMQLVNLLSAGPAMRTAELLGGAIQNDPT